MARGWESKSVESQQDEAASRVISGKARLTREEAERSRKRDELQLALRSVIHQIERSREGRHRTMLEAARADLERKIEALAA